ncbi:hypothetical protein [Actinomycetospora sp. TBRC 11914]|uniref:hypothetical protein n=1 Tax=Actinomycetospora sp. TBRC 11914 TaxID=2729387 RepID=UPI00145DE1A0|nr:hypothetical protein [Actinomycetospora sp. TBRC 11914]NMO94042.1 hypothetical protein [Actinomycetospora sp. TBRC 11914]
MTIQDAGGRGPSAGGTEPGERLDTLVPGLADACVDLLDAVYDRVDETGPGRPVLLARLCARLQPTWSTASPDERVLALLDALRTVLGIRGDDQPPSDLA